MDGRIDAIRANVAVGIYKSNSLHASPLIDALKVVFLVRLARTVVSTESTLERYISL